MTLHDALKQLLREIDALVPMAEFSRASLDRFHALRKRLHGPIDQFLAAEERHLRTRERVQRLVDAVGEYVIRFNAEPELRAERQRRIEKLAARIQADLKSGAGATQVPPLFASGWEVTTEARGRFSVRSPAKETACGTPTQEMLRGVLAAAAETQAHRYPAEARPPDRRGKPGGLLTFPGVDRLVVVGDLRGRYGHFTQILEQTGLLNHLDSAETHLVLTGNAFHPAAGQRADTEDFRQSAALLALVAGLRVRYPENVHYLRGNFDHAHTGGITGGPGRRQDKLFYDGLARIYSGAIMLLYQQFAEASPVAARFKEAPQALLIVHTTVPYGLDSEERLTGALMSGPRSKLLEDILWSRRYDSLALQGVRSSMGVRFVLTGHAPFPEEPAERFGLTPIADSPFAHREEAQIVIGSHAATFGYLDIDLSLPLPQKVTGLRAPDGRGAMRVITEARH